MLSEEERERLRGREDILGPFCPGLEITVNGERVLAVWRPRDTSFDTAGLSVGAGPGGLSRLRIDTPCLKPENGDTWRSRMIFVMANGKRVWFRARFWPFQLGMQLELPNHVLRVSGPRPFGPAEVRRWLPRIRWK